MSANVIGVRFRDVSKIYHFAPPDYPISVGDYVIVDTARGADMARVVVVPDENAGDVPSDVQAVVRLADRDDRDRASAMRDMGDRMLERARQLLNEHKLDMYMVSCQVNLASSDVICHFQADGHVDFRVMTDALEDEFDVRIRMQQAGPRDRARLVDGYDICGLRLCCSAWMTSFPQVGIRMAKEQDLALNPDKISGVCGRLLCCLTFEYPIYREMRGTLPKVGKRVSTPAGMGKVVQLNTLKQTVMIVVDGAPGRIEVPAVEIGTTVRPESAPNQALADHLSADVAVAEPDAPDTRAPDSRSPEPASTGDADSAGERPRRRRRRRDGERGGEAGAAPPRDGGGRAPESSAGPTEARAEGPHQDRPSTDAATGSSDGEARPRRRRRRRRRPRTDGQGSGQGGDGAGGGSAPSGAD